MSAVSHSADSPSHVQIPVSARLSRPLLHGGSGAGGEATPASGAHASAVGSSGPIGRRRLYDQNLSDFTARFRKNKKHLEDYERECHQLRAEAAKQQAVVDEAEGALARLEDRSVNELVPRYEDAKSTYEAQTQQKQSLAAQLTELRKLKAQLTKERKGLQSDFERRHSERLKTAEARDRLEAQLQQLNQQLAQLSNDRRRMERELEAVQNNLRAHTDLADEVHSEIEHVCDGIKFSNDLTSASTRAEVSLLPSEAGGHGFHGIPGP